MNKTSFSAQLWHLKKDKENEVTLVFKIPASDYINTIAIPTQQEITITVDWENDDLP